MNLLLPATLWHIFLLLLLLAKDKNDGEKLLFKQQKWTSSDVVIIMAVINIQIYLIYFLSGFQPAHTILKKIRFAYIPFSYFLLLTILFKFKFKQNISILGLKRDNWGKLLGTALVIAFINYLINLFICLLGGNLSACASNQVSKIAEFSSPQDYIFYLLTGLFLAPFMEESIYRGIFYAPYRKKYGPLKASLITALLFASSHYTETYFYSLIFGFLLGMLYEKTESIFSTIIAHSTYNLLAFLTTLYLIQK